MRSARRRTTSCWIWPSCGMTLAGFPRRTSGLLVAPREGERASHVQPVRFRRQRLQSELRRYLIVFEPQTFVLDQRRRPCRTLSPPFVPRRSQNFTSRGAVRPAPAARIDTIASRADSARTPRPPVVDRTGRDESVRSLRGGRGEAVSAYTMHDCARANARSALNTPIFHRSRDARQPRGGRATPSSPLRPSESREAPARRRSPAVLDADYELFNCSNFNMRCWSWSYRGCWHQTCPPIGRRRRL